MDENDFEARLDRLKAAVRQKTDSALADCLGIRQSSIAGARRRNLVPGEWVEKIALDYNINADWILFGRGTMHGGASAQPAPHAESTASLDDLVMIPMVEAVLSAGSGSLETSAQITREYAFRRDFIRRKGNPAHMVLMRVAGDSMQPEIMDKDVVLLDQSRTRLDPGPIYAIAIEDSIYLKRVDKLPRQLVLKSVNPAYAPIHIEMGEQTDEQVMVIGQVLWVGREYR